MYVRNIERGSKILTITNDKLIFQHSRGNLETINHKILMLRKVHQLYYNKKYRDAFQICKTNKLDLNLIFDLNPVNFIDNCV